MSRLVIDHKRNVGPVVQDELGTHQKIGLAWYDDEGRLWEVTTIVKLPYPADATASLWHSLYDALYGWADYS